MKKIKISFLMIILVASVQVIAQQNYFLKGDKVVNLGVGLGSAGYFGGHHATSFPPVSLAFELGLKDCIFDKGVIGVGGYTSFSTYKFDNGKLKSKSKDFVLAGRLSLHYPFLDKLDTYGGVILGADIVSTEASLYSTSTSYTVIYSGTSAYSETPYYSIDSPGTKTGVAFAIYVGARYCFSEKILAFAELGYGIAVLNIGIAYKL